jgi:hypothetical protein
MHLTAKPPDNEKTGGFALAPQRTCRFVRAIEPAWAAKRGRHFIARFDRANHYTRASSHLDPRQSSLFHRLRCAAENSMIGAASARHPAPTPAELGSTRKGPPRGGFSICALMVPVAQAHFTAAHGFNAGDAGHMHKSANRTTLHSGWVRCPCREESPC